jgi:hypothetical protein
MPPDAGWSKTKVVKMVNEDILGGLKAAIQRGSSIQSSMVSFINAGYSQQEVEEAANIIQSGIFPVQSIPPRLLRHKKRAEGEGVTQKTSEKIVSQLTEAAQSTLRPMPSTTIQPKPLPQLKPVLFEKAQSPKIKSLSTSKEPIIPQMIPFTVQQLPPGQQPVYQPQQIYTPQPIPPGQTPQPQQIISAYGPYKRSSGQMAIILLITLLVILLGMLATVFFFREEIMNWFSNLF